MNTTSNSVIITKKRGLVNKNTNSVDIFLLNASVNNNRNVKNIC